MKRVILLITFLALVFSAFAQWNNWCNAKTVRKIMHKAQDEKMTYFSQFHLWDVRSKNIHSSYYHDRTGEVLFVYALDFYYASGSYFADDYKAECRANIVEVVKKQWREYRAIPCFSWHLENPYVASGYEYMGCRYRKDDKKIKYPEAHNNVVREILTGVGGVRCGYGRYSGKETQSWANPRIWFDDRCREVASIIRELVDDNSKPIPIIFRPWHECEDSWMWWGGNYVTPEEYKELFILTKKKIEKYARKSQILWAYSPDSYWRSEADFMLRYPGDKYVDFIGFDDYQLGDPLKFETEVAKARIVTGIAIKHNKIAALFEGANCIEQTSNVYFSKYLDPLLSDRDVNFTIAQLWSTCLLINENQLSDRKWFLSQPYILKVK